MTEMSPAVRRFAALAILVLLVMGSIEIVAWPLLGSAWQNLDELHALRLERAQLEQTDARPLLKAGDPVPVDLYVHATAAAQAMSQLSELVRSRAQTSTLTLNGMTPVPSASASLHSVALDVRLTGKEPDVISFLNAIESGRPLIRVSQWSLSTTEPAHDQVQLSARLVTAWGQP